MKWDRRVIMGSSAALAILAAVGVWMVFSRLPASPSYSSLPSYASSPVLVRKIVGPQNVPLTRPYHRPALVVVPRLLPDWAKREIEHQVGVTMMHRRQFIWDGISQLFVQARHWAIPGLYPFSIAEYQPTPGISTNTLMLVQSSTPVYSKGPFFLNQRQWNVKQQSPVSTSLSITLSRKLKPLIPNGGVLAAINGRGQIRMVASNPSNRHISWQPRPVGLGLVPPLIAEAMAEPQLLKQRAHESDILEQLGKDWGGKKIQQALIRLGLDRGVSVSGQLVKNPGLPKPSSLVLSEGHALWATPLEVARAYLPFVDQGELPSLTIKPVPTTFGGGQPLVAPVSTLNAVTKFLPTVVTSGIRFSVWRPDSNYAIAYTSMDHGLVLVAGGPATSHIIALIHETAVWLTEKKGIGG